MLPAVLQHVTRVLDKLISRTKKLVDFFSSEDSVGGDDMFVVDNLVSYQEVKAIVPNLCQEINDEIKVK